MIEHTTNLRMQGLVPPSTAVNLRGAAELQPARRNAASLNNPHVHTRQGAVGAWAVPR